MTTARKAPAKKAAPPIIKAAKPPRAPRKAVTSKATKAVAARGNSPAPNEMEVMREPAQALVDAMPSPAPEFTRLDIPRHKVWNGPLVMPAGTKAEGDRTCPWCGRACKTGKRGNKTGDCPCQYYKRATTFIDVLADQTALKAWDRRMVAYGMGQRPDLVLSASATDPGDKDKVQKIADEAKEFAGASKAATTGTSLHTLTQWMDEGKELGFVPDPYPADLRAYALCTRDIEWVSIESFRVDDEWMVGGTADRIGWYRGRLTIFDLKTGGLYFKPGPAMQLAMYAHSTPYDIATDTRFSDEDELRLDVGYIIHLPQGSGKCELMPVNIENGWAACQHAKTVWDIRNQPDTTWLPGRDKYGEFYEMALRATNVKECKMLWQNAKDEGVLDDSLKAVITARAEQHKAGLA